MATSTVTNMLYVAYGMPGCLIAFDLATDEIVWTFKDEPSPVTVHFMFMFGIVPALLLIPYI
jgi:hypothetical protein